MALGVSVLYSIVADFMAVGDSRVFSTALSVFHSRKGVLSRPCRASGACSLDRFPALLYCLVCMFCHHPPDKTGQLPGNCCFCYIWLFSIPKHHMVIFPPHPFVCPVGIGDHSRRIPLLPFLQGLGFIPGSAPAI